MKKLIVIASSVVLTLLLVFGASEVYLRTTGEYWTVNNTLKFENSIFSRHVIAPKRQTVKKFGNPSIQLRINRHGYRGEDFTPKKPDDQYRVMVYGGSQVFDHTGKPPGWPDLAERRLHERGYTDFQLINAGIPGHASFDSYGRLYANDHYYDPDVVVMVNAWNDFKYFHYDSSPIRQVKVYRKENNPRRYYQNPLDRFLGETSQTYTVLRQYGIHFLSGGRRKTEDTQERARPTAAALKQYRLTLRAFVEFAHSIDATPVLMTQPRLVTPSMSESDRRRISYHYLSLTPEGLLNAYRRSDRIIETVTSSTESTLFDASDTLTGRSQYFVDHVHFTERGSEAMAEFTADRLVDVREAENGQPEE